MPFQKESKRSVRPEGDKPPKAEKTVRLEETDYAELSPMEQHLRARAKVDPEHMISGARKILPPKSVVVSNDNLPVGEAEIKARQQEAAFSHAAQYRKSPPPAPPHKPEYSASATQSPHQIEPASGAVNVVDLRMGEHPGKTRLVLDLTGASGFSYDMNNKDHVLFVELPGAGWAGQREKIMGNHPLIAGYMAQPAGARGSTLAIKLKKNTKVVFSSALPPNEVRGHRIVLDLTAL